MPELKPDQFRRDLEPRHFGRPLPVSREWVSDAGDTTRELERAMEKELPTEDEPKDEEHRDGRPWPRY